ncbi:MAG: Chromosomal replication initiator protein DnaA, partial [Pseudomonadota bacterium]
MRSLFASHPVRDSPGFYKLVDRGDLRESDFPGVDGLYLLQQYGHACGTRRRGPEKNGEELVHRIDKARNTRRPADDDLMEDAEAVNLAADWSDISQGLRKDLGHQL